MYVVIHNQQIELIFGKTPINEFSIVLMRKQIRFLLNVIPIFISLYKIKEVFIRTARSFGYKILTEIPFSKSLNSFWNECTCILEVRA